MNPFDYWYEKNINNIKDFMLRYYEDSMEILYPSIIDNEIVNDIQKLFLQGSTIEKLQVLTVLSSVKFYFNIK